MTTMEMNVNWLTRLANQMREWGQEPGPDFRLEKNCSSLEGKKKLSLA